MKSEEKPAGLERRGTPENPTVKGWTACRGSPYCRYPGRIPVNGEYLCVDHFAWDERRYEIPNWELGKRA